MLDFFLSEVGFVSKDDQQYSLPLSYGALREAERLVTGNAYAVMTAMVLGMHNFSQTSFVIDSFPSDHQFLRFRPSILASVCLAVARRQARIEPLWSERLERKTGYTINDIAECFTFTWAYVL